MRCFVDYVLCSLVAERGRDGLSGRGSRELGLAGLRRSLDEPRGNGRHHVRALLVRRGDQALGLLDRQRTSLLQQDTRY